MRKGWVLIIFTIAFHALYSFAEDLKITGSFSQGYIKSYEYNFLADDSKEGSFNFSEMSLNLLKNIDDSFHMGIGVSARKLGSLGDNTVELNWIYGDYRYKEFLGFRAGRMKAPFGFYNEVREMDMFRTGILLPIGTYPEDIRDFFNYLDGVCLYGSFSSGYLGLVSYQAIGGTKQIDVNSGSARVMKNLIREYSFEISAIDTENNMNVIDIKWETPVPGFSLGYSRFDVGDIILNFEGTENSQATVFSENIISAMVSGRYCYGNFTFTAEYYEIDTDNRLEISGLTLGSVKVHNDGWYINPSYRFFDWLEVGISYSAFFACHNYSANWEDVHKSMKDTSMSVRFDVNANWIIKLEGHIMDGTGYELQNDNPDNDFSENDWYVWAVKISYYF